MTRIVNVPSRAIGDKTVGALTQWAREMGVPVYAVLQVLAEAEAEERQVPVPLGARARHALLEFTALIEELNRARHELNLLELLDLVLERTGYAAHVQDGTD